MERRFFNARIIKLVFLCESKLICPKLWVFLVYYQFHVTENSHLMLFQL